MSRYEQGPQVKTAFFSPGVDRKLAELLRGEINEAVARANGWKSDTYLHDYGARVPRARRISAKEAGAAISLIRECARQKANKLGAISPRHIADADPARRNLFLELVRRAQAQPRVLVYEAEWKRPDQARKDDVRLGRLVRVEQLGLLVNAEAQEDGVTYKVENTGKVDEGILEPGSVFMFFPGKRLAVQLFVHRYNLPGLHTENIEQALFFKRTAAGWVYEEQDLQPGSCAVWTGKVFSLLRPEAPSREEEWVTPFLEVVLFAWEVFTGLHDLPAPKRRSAKPVPPERRSRIGSCVRTYERRGRDDPCARPFVRRSPKKQYCGDTCRKHTSGYERLARCDD